MIWIPSRQRTLSMQKIPRKDNVAVRVTDGSVFRDLLRFAKNRIEAFRAKLRALNFRLVPESKFPANLGRSLVVAEENHFNVWMQELPALQRVPLNHIDVTPERFRRGKKRNHQGRFPASPVFRRTNPPSA